MRRGALLVAAPYLAFALFALSAVEHTVDDAFISFRYARNLAGGHGLVFNPGEYVEGYSNPLWVYALALIAAAGADLEVAAKALGVVMGFVSLALFDRLLTRHFDVRRGLRHTAMLFLAGHGSLVYYAVAGLETVLYTALVLLLQLALLESRFALAALSVGLAGVCRPEGPLLLAPLALGLGLALRPRAALRYLLLAAAPIAAQLAFRQQYYGGLVANTFNAKIEPTGLLAQLLDNADGFALQTAAWLGSQLAFGGLGALGLAGMILFARTRPVQVLSVAVLSFFSWYSGGDWMAFGRFYVPILPLVLVFAFGAWSRALERWPLLARPPLMAAGAAAVVLIGWCGTVHSLELLAAGEGYDPAMSARRYFAAAHYIRARAEPNDVIAAPEIGVLAYVTGLRTIDQLGLTDAGVPPLLASEEMWHDPAHPAWSRYADYIFGQRPRFVVVGFDRGGAELDPIARALLDRMTRDRSHSLEKTFMLSSHTGMQLFVSNHRVAPGAITRIARP